MVQKSSLLYVLLLISTTALSQEVKEVDVVIVGAGVAGLAAATRLLKKSNISFTVLEAENRIGGRVYTTELSKDDFVNVGAELCAGQKNNVVYELSKNYNVLEPEPLVDVFDKVFYSSGKRLDTDLSSDLLHPLHVYLGELRLSNDTIGKAFKDKYYLPLLQKYQNDTKKLKVVTDSLTFFQRAVLSLIAAPNWNDVAADNHVESDAKNFIWTRQGYNTFVDILIEKYPNPENELPLKDKINLIKRVVEIKWQGEPKIRTKCSDGSVWLSDFVIFTPSLGVLKKHKETLFTPKLPSDKLAVIDELGFGAIMRIIFHFPEKWWGEDDSIFFLIWSEKDLQNLKSEFTWLSSVAIIQLVNKKSHSWNFWVAGDNVPEIELLSESTLRNGGLLILDKFLGKSYNITKPDKVLWSHWKNDPNFLGTYSYERAKYFNKNVSNQERLGKPLVDNKDNLRVLFAGEATSLHQPSTVQGATETGFAAAERLIQASNTVV